MKCPKCHKSLEDDATRCVHCGSNIPRCPVCNRVVYRKTDECRYCGTPLPRDVLEIFDERKAPPSNNNLPLIIALCVIIGILLCAVIFAIISFLGSGRGGGVTPTTQAPVVTTASSAPTPPTTSTTEAPAATDEYDHCDAYYTAMEYASQAESKVMEYDGHAYAIFNFKDLGLYESYTSCERFCESMGGHLAVIGSQEENDAIYDLLLDTRLVVAHFGYSDELSEGTWRWVDGSGSSFTNWCRRPGKEQPNNGANSEGHPKEDYAEFYKETQDGTWNDAKFGVNTYRFVCEWEY